MAQFRHRKDPRQADRLTVWLPDDRVYGRRGQITVMGPNGQRMSMSAAAKLAGVPRRTVIARIREGRQEKDWYFKGNLRYPNPRQRCPVKQGPKWHGLRGVDEPHKGRTFASKRKKTDATVLSVKRPRIHAWAIRNHKRSLAKAARAKAAAADQGSRPVE
jgi:hypothetical protein